MSSYGLTVRKQGDDDDDDDKEDLEELMEQDKLKRKQMTPSLYSKVASTEEYVTKGEDHKSRLLTRTAWVEKQLEAAMLNVPKETEEEAAQRQMESDLAR